MKRRAICTDPSWVGRVDCVHCTIRNRVLFADLTPDELNQVLLVVDDLVYQRGSMIYRQGEAGNALFTIRRGIIKLVRETPDGHQRIVRLMSVGDVAGIEVAIGSPYKHSAIAIGECQLCRIPAPVIERLDIKHPHLARQLMVRWQRSLDNADRALVEFSTGPADARVARLLLFLSSLTTDGRCADIGRQDMGALLGITTETASRVVADFRRRGLVEETGDGVHCHCNVDLLKQIAHSG
ncbi:MAG: Crp/Fnr family transcriptional regulator [Methylococcus sp.]|nr:MAG: Crp/Fnr family transcriptional regulator [Methylococcus sp.]